MKVFYSNRILNKRKNKPLKKPNNKKQTELNRPHVFYLHFSLLFSLLKCWFLLKCHLDVVHSEAIGWIELDFKQRLGHKNKTIKLFLILHDMEECGGSFKRNLRYSTGRHNLDTVLLDWLFMFVFLFAPFERLCVCVAFVFIFLNYSIFYIKNNEYLRFIWKFVLGEIQCFLLFVIYQKFLEKKTEQKT